MRKGVNREVDSKTDWSSFQSLKERKMKRLLWLEVWDYKRGKKSNLKGLLLFSKSGDSVELWGRNFMRFLEGFFL